MIYPLIWMIFSSFKESSLVLKTVGQLSPSEWRTDNYVNGWAGFGGTTFATFFKNSFIVTILTVIGSVLASAMAAYGFSRIRFKGRSFWFICMMITMMVPSQILMVPQYVLFHSLNWVDTFLPLIVPGLLAVGVYSFLMTWDDYLHAITLVRSPSLWTLSQGLKLTYLGEVSDWQLINAASTLGAVPMIFVFFFFQKYMVRGLVAGAVKG